MSLRQFPRTYIALVLMEFVGQPVLFLATGSPLHPSPGGLIILALIVMGIARRSYLAWGLLLTWTAFEFFAVTLLLASSSQTTAGIAWLFYNAASLALLLSPTMRRYLGAHRRHAVRTA
jgi:hypothetical protein